MLQDDYSVAPAIGIPGMFADGSLTKDVITGLNEDTVPVPFAVGVTQGLTDDGFRLPTTLTDMLKGLTLFEHRADHFHFAADGAIAVAEVSPLVRKGRIFVLPEQDIKPTDRVFWRVTPGGAQGGTPGRFRKDADNDGTTDHAILVPQLRWHTSGVRDSLVVLDSNLS